MNANLSFSKISYVIIASLLNITFEWDQHSCIMFISIDHNVYFYSVNDTRVSLICMKNAGDEFKTSVLEAFHSTGFY